MAYYADPRILLPNLRSAGKGQAEGGPADGGGCAVSHYAQDDQMIRMRVVLVFPVIAAILAAALAAGARAGKAYRVGLISRTTPVARIVSAPTHTVNSDFRREMRDRG